MNSHPTIGKPRALIVDDTPSLLSCFRLLLHPMERTWELLYATGGEEALDIVCDKALDVLICDLNMPFMMGSEVVSLVLLKHPNTDCYLMTGCTADDSLVSAVCGLRGIFQKPCDLGQIRAVLEARTSGCSLVPTPLAA
ncbi:MAG: response regulator [Kiritimatiellia bacterium]|jgi:DNA-binding NarL/FixJ family response regulator|nr:response regulator [Kiritimatiellia bacterium]MDP6630326.1 response regulator [Kiritimatiellia bacterium]MDP6810833.1 response regulator [Kiritimatiellia bacterium]MDP7024175.1 response regulator [Kiritimatiellia bacterium]